MIAIKLSHDKEIPEKLLGKPFGKQGLSVVLEEVHNAKPHNRSEIARRVCKRFEWKSPGGKYQFMSARVALLRLHRAGLIELPPPIKSNGNGKKLKHHAVSLPEINPVEISVEKLHGLKLQHVQGTEQSSLYNSLMDLYHYLGYTPMAGSQIRYLFTCDHGVLGAIGFGASAWKIAPRDSFIGWDMLTREKNLHMIANNSRFLILPWVHSPNLASKILSMCAKRIPKDFLDIYGYSPVLLETFVEKERFRGGCYRAANWLHVGETQGRGKKHNRKNPGVPIKDIWLYPLHSDFRNILQSRGDK